jgi:hypothetical protein
MKPRTAIALCQILFLLAACDSQDGEPAQSPFRHASAIRQSLACPLPTGAQLFQPLRAIAPSDTEKQQLARELVELRRRQLLVSWTSAAQYLNQDQATLDNEQQQMRLNLVHIDNLLQAFVTREYAFSDQASEFVQSMADQYRHHCELYRATNRKLITLQDQLPSLRKNKHQPWLSPSRRLTCSMQVQPGCFPD